MCKRVVILLVVLIVSSNFDLQAQKQRVKNKDGYYSLSYLMPFLNAESPFQVNHVKWLFDKNDDFRNLLVSKADTSLPSVYSTLPLSDSISKTFSGLGWFRIHILMDTLAFKNNALQIAHQGAVQVFIDGEFVSNSGLVSNLPDEEISYYAKYKIIPLPEKKPGEWLHLAIRYSNTEYLDSYNSVGKNEAGFGITITPVELLSVNFINNAIFGTFIGTCLLVLFFTLSCLHFLLYIFYKAKKANLYYSLFCLILGYVFSQILFTTIIQSKDELQLLNFIIVLVTPFFFYLLVLTLNTLFDFKHKFNRFVFVITICTSIAGIINNFVYAGFLVVLVGSSLIYVLFILYLAYKNKKRGIKLIGAGFGFFAGFVILFFAFSMVVGTLNLGEINIGGVILITMLCLCILSIPSSMTIFLAWDFAQTNKTLSVKLKEVEELSEKTIEQEKEKQKLLAEQNSMLEFQVKERTKEIEEQKKVIEEKNKDITDSINYAQRIQHSILPTSKEIKDIFPDSLVLFKPRDIVSGDFYQFKQLNNYRFGILADCTGHGVPGALMSMIGSNLLHQIIMERKIVKPNLILTELHKEVKSTLRQTAGVQSHDGMDIAVCMVNGNELFIASANRPVYLFLDGVLNEIKPDKKSIGGASTADVVEFTLHSFKIESEIKLYTFSDGYADQFGGVNGKKFKVKNLQELIVANLRKPLNEQLEILGATFENWRGTLEQVDDVSLISIHLKP